MFSEDLRDGINVIGRSMSLLLLLLCHTCFALEVTVPSSQIVTVQTDALLTCTFRVEKPPINLQFLAIFWHYGENGIVTYDSKTKESTSRFTIDEQAVMRGDASLTIHNVTVSDRGTYKCTVVYSPNNQAKQIQLNILAVPVVKIQKYAIQKGVTSLLQCSIENFFPKEMRVIWLKNGQNLRGSVTTDDKTNADNTFTRISSVNVNFLKEQGNPNITCQVEHEYLQDPIKDFYTVQYGTAPTVNIKASRTPDGNDQIYVCEAANYFPEEVTMHWVLDGNKINSPQQSGKGYFNKEISYTIQLQGQNPPSQISCEVQHETLQSPIKMTEEVKVSSDCKRSCHFGLIAALVGLLVTGPLVIWYFTKKYSQRFQVGHIHRMQTGEKVTMYCTASNCPEDVQVTWRITGNDKQEIIIYNSEQGKDEEKASLVVSHDYTVETERSRADNLHHAISALSFTPTVSKHKELEVSCTFHCNKRSQEKRLKCNFTFKKPQGSGPVKLSLGDNGDVLCLASLQNFYPKAIKIKWSHNLGNFQDLETCCEEFTKNDDFTFNVKSECRIPGHLLKDQGYRVRATWSHESETGQQEASITDSGWRPVMGEIEKPTFIDGKQAKLLCPVSGYFPDVLEAKWLRRDAKSQELYVVSDSDKYKIPIMEATQEEDKTFTYLACLILSASASADYGAEFICRVRHPSIATPLEKRTGEIRVIGIRAVNVTLLNNNKSLRAEVLHFTEGPLKITWSRQKNNKAYEEYKDPVETTETNSDTLHSDITLTHTNQTKKHYKVVVKDDASKSEVEKIIIRENDEFYLLDNENKKTRLEQFSEQQQDSNNVIAENPAETQRDEESKDNSVKAEEHTTQKKEKKEGKRFWKKKSTLTNNI